MFILNQKSRDPLYVQLYKQIKGQVLSGKMLADTKLPSVRELAEELSISRNTVESTYQELYAEGYIYAKPRSGYFVAALDPVAAPLPLAGHTPALAPSIPDQRAYAYDFHPAGLDAASFPAALWRKYTVEYLREHADRLSQYAASEGEQELRVQIRHYLERSRGVLCAPEQIVICSGLQHSLDIVAHLLKDAKPHVAVEDPGYPLARAVFQNHGFPVTPIPVGEEGIDLTELARSQCNIAYVTPSHQFPSGHVLPIEHRLRLIEWSDSGGNFIIEDDYDSELRYHGKPMPSLQGLHPHGNIIYTGTFSKTLSPALRVSYMVLPPHVLAQFRKAFRNYISTASLLEQHTLSMFLKNGHFERHIRRMRSIYKKKHDALLDAIERHFGPRAQVSGQGAGLHLVLQLSGPSPVEPELLAKAESQGVRLFPYSETRADGGTDSGRVLLGFGAMTAEELEGGIALLSRIWL